MRRLVFLLAAFVGCGGTVNGSGGGGGTGGSGGSGCPATMPAQSAACADEGLKCEYGDGPIVSCRPSATCSNGGWQVYEVFCDPHFTQPPECPATQPTAGATCDVMVDPSLCQYASTFCGCTNCAGGPCSIDATWVCATPNIECPAEPALLGTACPSEGQDCVYGNCGLGQIYTNRRCESGIWVADELACPV